MCLTTGEFIWMIILWLGIIPLGFIAGAIFLICQIVKITQGDAASRNAKLPAVENSHPTTG